MNQLVSLQVCLIGTFHIQKDIVWSVAFCAWFLSRGVMFSGVSVWYRVSISFLFMAANAVRVDLSLCIFSLVDGR